MINNFVLANSVHTGEMPCSVEFHLDVRCLPKYTFRGFQCTNLNLQRAYYIFSSFQLDAKNSPLALLAQTCSSIGKDPPSKSVIPPLEKKDKGHEKPQSVDSNKGTRTPPRIKDTGRLSNDKSRPGSNEEAKDLSHFRPLSTSSPKQDKINEQNYHKESMDKKPPECATTSVIGKPIPTPNMNSSKLSMERNEDRSPRPKVSEPTKDIKEVRDSPPLKRQRSASPMRSEHSPAMDSKYPPSMYPGLPLGPWGYPGLPYPPGLLPSAEAYAASGLPLGMPGQAGYSMSPSVQASALAAHHAALKSGSSLSNYLQYARMRAPSAQGPLVPPCRDPYCTNCLVSAQSSHLASQCTSPGCAQCSHEKSLQNMGLSALGLHSSVPGLPPYSSASGLPSASAGLSSLHNLYAHNLLTQQQGHPHVCNWMSGSDYCGKRFTTSEELLQHLRTHTSGGEAALAAYGSLGISIPSHADISALQGYLGSSGNHSPSALRRTYPSSLSPLTNSALHASRYHPYKSNMPVGLPPPHSLAPYYSAYGLYGQRIGSAAVP